MALGLSFLFGAVDINTASKKELSGLNGIGATKADAIIAYRNTNCFKNVKELAKVKGIGSKTVEKNMSNLTASSCKK
jgi:competence protein ComEA